LQNQGVQNINSRFQVMTAVVVHHDVKCRRVKKSNEESENGIKYMWNEIKSWGDIYRVVMDEI
jgi:hypothetical protein